MFVGFLIKSPLSDCLALSVEGVVNEKNLEEFDEGHGYLIFSFSR